MSLQEAQRPVQGDGQVKSKQPDTGRISARVASCLVGKQQRGMQGSVGRLAGGTGPWRVVITG